MPTYAARSTVVAPRVRQALAECAPCTAIAPVPLQQLCIARVGRATRECIHACVLDFGGAYESPATAGPDAAKINARVRIERCIVHTPRPVCQAWRLHLLEHLVALAVLFASFACLDLDPAASHAGNIRCSSFLADDALQVHASGSLEQLRPIIKAEKSPAARTLAPVCGSSPWIGT